MNLYRKSGLLFFGLITLSMLIFTTFVSLTPLYADDSTNCMPGGNQCPFGTYECIDNQRKIKLKNGNIVKECNESDICMVDGLNLTCKTLDFYCNQFDATTTECGSKSQCAVYQGNSEWDNKQPLCRSNHYKNLNKVSCGTGHCYDGQLCYSVNGIDSCDNPHKATTGNYCRLNLNNDECAYGNTCYNNKCTACDSMPGLKECPNDDPTPPNTNGGGTATPTPSPTTGGSGGTPTTTWSCASLVNIYGIEDARCADSQPPGNNWQRLDDQHGCNTGYLCWILTPNSGPLGTSTPTPSSGENFCTDDPALTNALAYSCSGKTIVSLNISNPLSGTTVVKTCGNSQTCERITTGSNPCTFGGAKCVSAGATAAPGPGGGTPTHVIPPSTIKGWCANGGRQITDANKQSVNGATAANCNINSSPYLGTYGDGSTSGARSYCHTKAGSPNDFFYKCPDASTPLIPGYCSNSTKTSPGSPVRNGCGAWDDVKNSTLYESTYNDWCRDTYGVNDSQSNFFYKCPTMTPTPSSSPAPSSGPPATSPTTTTGSSTPTPTPNTGCATPNPSASNTGYECPSTTYGGCAGAMTCRADSNSTTGCRCMGSGPTNTPTPTGAAATRTPTPVASTSTPTPASTATPTITVPPSGSACTTCSSLGIGHSGAQSAPFRPWLKNGVYGCCAGAVNSCMDSTFTTCPN